MATRTAPRGIGASWQVESDRFMSCIAMRHSMAATGGWSRFETNTVAWPYFGAGMTAILTEILMPSRKVRAARRAGA